MASFVDSAGRSTKLILKPIAIVRENNDARGVDSEWDGQDYDGKAHAGNV